MKKFIIEKAQNDPQMDNLTSGSDSKSDGQQSSPVFRIQQSPPGKDKDKRYVTKLNLQ